MCPAPVGSAAAAVDSAVAVEYDRRTHGFEEFLRRDRRISSPSIGLEHFWPEFIATVYTRVIGDYYKRT